MTTIIDITGKPRRVDDAYERDEVCGCVDGNLVIRQGQRCWKDGQEWVVKTTMRREPKDAYLRRHPEVALCLFLEQVLNLETIRNCTDRAFAEMVMGDELGELDHLYQFAKHALGGISIIRSFITKSGLTRERGKWEWA